MEKSAEAWWTMKTEDGRVGLIPKQYVQATRPRPVSHFDQLDPKVCGAFSGCNVAQQH